MAAAGYPPRALDVAFTASGQAVLAVVALEVEKRSKCTLLEEAGFAVLEVASADEAWPLLEGRSDIEVLFTDINMPGSMDRLTSAARVAERWPDIRLVLTSGRLGVSSDKVPDDGQFVQKPYRQSELLSAIANAV